MLPDLPVVTVGLHNVFWPVDLDTGLSVRDEKAIKSKLFLASKPIGGQGAFYFTFCRFEHVFRKSKHTLLMLHD